MSAIDTVNRYPNWFSDVDEQVCVQTQFGLSLYCDRRSGIGQTLIAEGKWEGLLSRTILACLSPGDTAIDIGANIGYDTMLMSQAVGIDGLVLAFEPVAQHMAMLLKNIRHQGNGNVIAHSAALSDRPSRLRIALYGDYNSGMPNLRPGETGPSQPIIATRFDNVAQGCDIDDIAFVKIDIEGFEMKAIHGMGAFLDRVQCLTCEVNPVFLRQCGNSPEELFEVMHTHGFKSFCAEPQSNDAWIASDHGYTVQLAGGRHFDALFCKEPSQRLLGLIR